MKMMQQTSLLAYEELVPELGEKQRRVYDCLRLFPDGLTDMEVAASLGVVDPNVVRPRRNELVKDGLVKKFCRRFCTVTGKLAIAWGVVKSV